MVRYADVLQVGARNMQNYRLLTELGDVGKPILLKRNPAATIEELLMSAEYILTAGNHRVILCERGVRGFESTTRYTLDLSAVPNIQGVSHLPVFVDPSHATGPRANSSSRWRWPPWPRAPRASWSKCTRIPRRR